VEGSSNSILTALGYEPLDKVVIVHQDDVGMCHGANVAFNELAGAGLVTCGSVMVPCPWFREIADLAFARPELDIGVHLTLNSEWRQYKWKPVSHASQASGLVDGDGYLWSKVPLVRQHAVPEAVETELRAQIDVAQSAGINVTHLDAHWGAATSPEFVEIYYRLGIEYDLPVLSSKSIGTRSRKEIKRDEPARNGPPLCDVFYETPWVSPGEFISAYHDIFDAIGPGLTVIAMHCNAPGDIEAIDPARAHCRIGEYTMARDPWFLSFVDGLDLKLVGYREIRTALRNKRLSEKTPSSDARFIQNREVKEGGM
jgi:predicted glycoside hydrolase/deacetylase ChbG (UPF0249 family)